MASDLPSNSGGSSWWLPWATAGATILVVYGSLFPKVGCREDSKSVRARIDCNQLGLALKAHALEYGALPQGAPAQVLGVICDDNPRKIPFFEPRLDQLSRSGEYLDPWGSPYRIVISQKNGPRVYSIGKDRVDDGGRPESDDVVSW